MPSRVELIQQILQTADGQAPGSGLPKHHKMTQPAGIGNA